MKPDLYQLSLVLFFLFFFGSSKLATSSMETRQGLEEVNLNQIGEPPSDLMGLEECDGGDEECFKGRQISEVHLDYIYTQHHRP